MATHSEISHTSFRETRHRSGRYEEIMVITGNIADNFPLPRTAPPTIVLGASAVRDILLPAAAADMDGLIFTLISNSTATTGVLTLKTSADAALVPAVTIAQGASVQVQYVHGIGWKRRS